MTDGDKLYRQILEDPADETLRLVYADWLQENDGPARCDYCRGRDECPLHDDTFDPHWHCPHCGGRADGFAARAEFIRLQVELSRCRGCGGRGWYWLSDGVKDVRHRCDLCRENRDRETVIWQRAFPTQQDWWLPIDDVKYAWHVTPHEDAQTRAPAAILRNGFVDVIRVESPSDRLLATVFSRQPVTKVIVTDRNPEHQRHPGLYGWYYDDGASPDRYTYGTPGTRLDFVIPQAVHALLGGQVAPHQQVMWARTWKFFESKEKAERALSDAYVDCARELCGLPELKRGEE